jgi:hypothetical protein
MILGRHFSSPRLAQTAKAGIESGGGEGLHLEKERRGEYEEVPFKKF